MVQFDILSGNQAGTRMVARCFPFRIGRAPGNELQLADDGIWDRHLTVEFNPEYGFSLTTALEAIATVKWCAGSKDRSSQRRRHHGRLGENPVLARRPPRQGSLRLRENFVWALLALVTLGQFALLYWADPLTFDPHRRSHPWKKSGMTMMTRLDSVQWRKCRAPVNAIAIPPVRPPPR